MSEFIEYEPYLSQRTFSMVKTTHLFTHFFRRLSTNPLIILSDKYNKKILIKNKHELLNIIPVILHVTKKRGCGNSLWFIGFILNKTNK